MNTLLTERTYNLKIERVVNGAESQNVQRHQRYDSLLLFGTIR